MRKWPKLLVLASIAVVAGWSDQEIANLLIFSRRSNGDDLKLREDYYIRTISKARGPVEQAEAQERLEEGGSLADLSILLGVEIIDLVKHLGDRRQLAGNLLWTDVDGGIDQAVTKLQLAGHPRSTHSQVNPPRV